LGSDLGDRIPTGRSLSAYVRRATPYVLLLAVAAMLTNDEASSAAPVSIRAANLRCEYAVDPLGIDAATPQLSWILEAARDGLRGEVQTAYQVVAGSTVAGLAAKRPELWDSGKVPSNRTLGIGYAGKPLRSGQEVFWKVRVWDRKGRASAWSAPARWEMALLDPDDWKGKWIAAKTEGDPDPEASFRDDPAPLFRREITLRKNVARARAYVTGLGYYELRINGERVGDHRLDPAWTSYSHRVFYSTYDVTRHLRQGANAVGALLGYGWYHPVALPLFGRFDLRTELRTGMPRLILHLEIEYVDGSRETLGTDESWKWTDGPIVRNSVYLGEVYDARREQPGWDQPGFDDRAWRPSVPAKEPLGPLQAQPLPPIRATRDVKPVAVTEPKPGVFIVDLGQNFAGVVSMKVNGEAGRRVTLRYGELLYPDGTLNPMTSVMGQWKNRPVPAGSERPRTAWQQDAYVLKGEGEETFTPRFTFHGFRYVELTGYPGGPPLDAVVGRRMNTDLEPAGEFSCSDPMLNRIQEVTEWTFLSNVFSVQSDCPHREKLGYGGDIVAASEMALLNYDMAAFYAKTVRDFADGVRPNGGFPETAPYVGIADEGLGEGSGPIGWGTAHPMLLWQLYQYYGERRLLEEQYPLAQRWLALLERSAKNGILDNGISDHESLVPKPRPLTGTAFYYFSAQLLARIASVLGKGADAERYAALAGSTKSAFNREFLHPGTGRYYTGTQACQSFALFFGLVPEAERAAALRVLVEDVEKHGGHLTTGIFGTKYMLRALTEAGRPEVAATIVGQKSFPGWGYMLEHGATTLWEHWEFSDNTFSHNHPMFGSVSEWFYRALAGINPAEEADGFDRIVLRPEPVPGLTWVKARYRSARGPITSEWRREGRRFSWTFEIPPNTTATIHVPASGPAGVTEGAKPAASVAGVRFVRFEGGRAVYEVDSGRYVFAAELPSG
jgi:alpha-L-rhamnosidase